MIKLTEKEWRTIHNALAVFQCTTRDAQRRKEVQELMDKVRDEAIAVILKENEPHEH
jgi:ketopantoate reductase